ncbi:hypothetical protein [Rhodopila globiformis]|uniref:Uncharacterized protein n=1 Tax=Rhodopila globiformis TaxID=1071 RepID=A0A2S6NLN2_RHOGL|nr:hypothetical protein [Rhodopila globiformis]PPQ36302.1 hypothetical protein CCS01_05260 [Rhodopila globiformis]
MQNKSLKAVQADVRALRQDLHAADDEKIRRVIAVLDEVADPRVNQAILDPLRSRLASLNPSRPLQFSRLLFMPLDPLIVPAPQWRPDEPSVPRTALMPLARIVRAALGSERIFIDRTIAGRSTGDTQAVALAGEALWPRAAEILADAPAPADWAETGLAPKVYQPLAQAIGAVLRRGPHLYQLRRDHDVGIQDGNEQAIDAILQGITLASEQGCALIARLVLVQSPHAAPLLRRFVSSGQDQGGGRMVREAIDRGTEEMLSAMEDEAGFASEIQTIALANAGPQVRRIVTFLREVENDPGFAADRPRLHAIRQKLDDACQARFSNGLNAELLAPLAEAPGPIGGAGQTRMESCSRDLRALETEARKVGGAARYDRLLQEATDAVMAAAAAGTLTPVRRLRLIEILAGAEAAAELYEKENGRG